MANDIQKSRGFTASPEAIGMGLRQLTDAALSEGLDIRAIAEKFVPDSELVTQPARIQMITTQSDKPTTTRKPAAPAPSSNGGQRAPTPPPAPMREAMDNNNARTSIVHYDPFGTMPACQVPMNGGGMVQGVQQMDQPLQQLLQQQGIPWNPRLGACPGSLVPALLWIWKSMCSYNQMGRVGTTQLFSNIVTVPGPFNFTVGPSTQPFGVAFPAEWSGETIFHKMWRVKLAFSVDVIQGDLDPEQIIRTLFDQFTFRVIQRGTEDEFQTAVSFGDAGDAERSVLTPSASGYFFEPNGEFIPYWVKPELQSFDLSGVGPGNVLVDSYAMQAAVRAYFASFFDRRTEGAWV